MWGQSGGQSPKGPDVGGKVPWRLTISKWKSHFGKLIATSCSKLQIESWQEGWFLKCNFSLGKSIL
jgi:hypothetical protein